MVNVRGRLSSGCGVFLPKSPLLGVPPVFGLRCFCFWPPVSPVPFLVLLGRFPGLARPVGDSVGCARLLLSFFVQVFFPNPLPCVAVRFGLFSGFVGTSGSSTVDSEDALRGDIGARRRGLKFFKGRDAPIRSFGGVSGTLMVSELERAPACLLLLLR